MLSTIVSLFKLNIYDLTLYNNNIITIKEESPKSKKCTVQARRELRTNNYCKETQLANNEIIDTRYILDS